MNYFENNNYLETPLYKNLETFKTYYAEQFRKDWSVSAVDIIQDAYCVGISEMWVESNLRQNDYIEIYKRIIIKCRSLTVQASQQQDSAWEEQLTTLKQHYQIELLKTLTSTIREFCMEA